MIKDILKDGFYYLISKSIVGLLSLAIIWISLKVYNVEIYGEYSVLYVLTLTISNFCYSWLTQSYIRMYNHSEIHFFTAKMSFIYSTILCLLLLLVITHIFKYNFFLCALLAISNGVYSVGRSILQSTRDIRRFFYYDLARITVQCSLVYGLSFFLNGVDGLIYATTLACLTFSFSYKYLVASNYSIDYKLELLKWIKFGTPVALWLTIASGQLLLDRKIISHNLTPIDVGAYSAIYDTIVRVCALIVIPLSNASYPILVSKNAEITSYRKIGAYLSLMSVIIAMGAATLTYLSYDYIQLFIDIYLSKASMAFLIFGVVLWQLAMLYQKPLEMQHRTLAMLVNIVLCFILSGVINIFFVRSLGLTIFPITISISAVVYLIMTSLWIKK